MSRNRNGYDGLKRRRANLLAQDPHCWYCGCEVFPPVPGDSGLLLPNSATVEHLHSRHSGPRPIRGSRVLACYTCNQDVGKWATILKKDLEAVRTS